MKTLRGVPIDLCRLCLQQTAEMEDIFKSAKSYKTLVSSLIGIKIKYNRQHPRLICTTCIKHLHDLWTFKQTCMRTEKALQTAKWAIEDKTLVTLVKKMRYHAENEKLKKLESKKDQITPTNEEDEEYEEEGEDEEQEEEEDEYKEEGEEEEEEEENEDDEEGREEEYEIEENEEQKLEEKLEPNIPGEIEICPNTQVEPILVRKIVGKERRMETCEICGKKFTSWHLKRHLNVHNKTRPLACPVEGCTKRFVYPINLKEHQQLSHSDEYPFKCDECGKPYKLKKQLDEHISTHSEKSVLCTICGKLFNHRRGLQKHMVAHVGDRPFSCDKCEKSFKNRYTLRVHQRVHTKEKPFVCSICGQGFGYNCVLKSHMQKHYEDKESEAQNCNNEEMVTLLMEPIQQEQPFVSQDSIQVLTCDGNYDSNGASVYVLSGCDAVPTITNSMPIISNDVQTISNVVPIISNDVPIISNDVPIISNVLYLT